MMKEEADRCTVNPWLIPGHAVYVRRTGRAIILDLKNTYISLDIIYVNDKKEIVSVQKYATLLSEEKPAILQARAVCSGSECRFLR